MDEARQDNARHAALDYHEFPKPGKLEIRATKPLANGRDLARAFYRVMPHPDGWRECMTLIVAPTCPATVGDSWAPTPAQ